MHDSKLRPSHPIAPASFSVFSQDKKSAKRSKVNKGGGGGGHTATLPPVADADRSQEEDYKISGPLDPFAHTAESVNLGGAEAAAMLVLNASLTDSNSTSSSSASSRFEVDDEGGGDEDSSSTRDAGTTDTAGP